MFGLQGLFVGPNEKFYRLHCGYCSKSEGRSWGSGLNTESSLGKFASLASFGHG